MRIAHVNLTTNVAAERCRFNELLARDFYLGSTLLHGSRDFAIRCGEGLNQPIRVWRNVLENATLTFWRNWDDIRQDGRDVYVLWFVRRGQFTLSQAGHDCAAEAGHCLIMTAGIPFRLQTLLDRQSRHESMCMLVPRHLVSSVSDEIPLAVPVSAEHGDGAAARGACQLLFDLGRQLSPDVAEALAATSIKAITRAIRGPRAVSDLPRSEERWLHIKAFIASQFSDPELSISKIAQRCNTSIRYVCSLAEAHDTTISELIWKSRLEKAKQWLQGPTMRHRTTAEIARMAGFKSAAHFSRRFKHAYGLAPREFRRLYRHTALTATAPSHRTE
jgi:AraC-like DNA-binding protein